MGGFFMLLIGYFVWLFRMYYHSAKEDYKQAKMGTASFYRNDRYQTAKKFNSLIYMGDYDSKSKQTLYYEVATGKQVVIRNNKLGLKKWFYADTMKALVYQEDRRIKDSLECNAVIAKLNDKKWCIAENFWDDSVVKFGGIDEAVFPDEKYSYDASNTYLDDFRDRPNSLKSSKWNEYALAWNKANPDKIIQKKLVRGEGTGCSTPEQLEAYKSYFYDNSSINQKVYLKNMRPYQLYLLGTSGTDYSQSFIKKRQYLIRFGNPDVFDYKTQHCITDKQVALFWSKWYAISEEEYLALTTTSADLPTPVWFSIRTLNTPSDLKIRLKPIKDTDIAFKEGIETINWDIADCGIKRAFDGEENFVEDVMTECENRMNNN